MPSSLHSDPPPPNQASDRISGLPFLSDDEFEEAYSSIVRDLSVVHWTPVEVCRTAAKFLVTREHTRVLDIGCGPGKFCAIGAAATSGYFTGVEQRQDLVDEAHSMLGYYGVPRTEIHHGNVMDLDFSGFDAFYLFNPFEENMSQSLAIDFTVDLGLEHYCRYTAYVRLSLAMAPMGTRVVTYHGNDDAIPKCYECAGIGFEGSLRFWLKTRQAQDEPPEDLPPTARKWLLLPDWIPGAGLGLAPA